MKKLVIFFSSLFIATFAFGQQFESTKDQVDTANKIHAKIGAAFLMEYQSINNSATQPLVKLADGIPFPMANMTVVGYMGPGLRLNMELYLANPHHTNTYVKDGYLLIDRLDFLHCAVVDNLMKYVSLKVGDMEINYGDQHFRRNDGGNGIRNVFAGNTIMDAFMTAPGAELNLNVNGLIAMVATCTGTINQTLNSYNTTPYVNINGTSYFPNTVNKYNTYDQLAYYFKLGYDKKFSDDLRARLMFSFYHCNNNQIGELYDGDRAGTDYQGVMSQIPNNANPVKVIKNSIGTVINTPTDPTAENQMAGYWNPGDTYKDNSGMINLLLQFKGLEFFGTYERATGSSSINRGLFDMTEIAAELIYRFGPQKQFYGAARWDAVNNNRFSMYYNLSNGTVNTSNGPVNDMTNFQNAAISDGRAVEAYEIAAGWYLTKNIVAKVQYINQKYYDFTRDRKSVV